METTADYGEHKQTIEDIAEAELLARHYRYRIVTNGFSYKIQRSEKKMNIFGEAWDSYQDLMTSSIFGGAWNSYQDLESFAPERFLETVYCYFPKADLEKIKKNDIEYLKKTAGPWEEIPT